MAGDHLGHLLGHRRAGRARTAVAWASTVGDRVAVHSENRPEWLYCDIGITAVRAATVGLYPTNPAPEVLHVLRDSGSSVLFAEDQEQVDKALDIGDQVPDLRAIVYLDPRGIADRYDDPRLMSWDDFLDAGRAHAAEHPGAVDALVDAADTRRPGHLGLHVRHDRPAQGRDAVHRERGLRDRASA